jgi:hypothetical protein
MFVIVGRAEEEIGATFSQVERQLVKFSGADNNFIRFFSNFKVH